MGAEKSVYLFAPIFLPSQELALAWSPALRRQDVRPAKAGTPCQPPLFMCPMRHARIVEAPLSLKVGRAAPRAPGPRRHERLAGSCRRVLDKIRDDSLRFAARAERRALPCCGARGARPTDARCSNRRGSLWTGLVRGMWSRESEAESTSLLLTTRGRFRPQALIPLPPFPCQDSYAGTFA